MFIRKAVTLFLELSSEAPPVETEGVVDWRWFTEASPAVGHEQELSEAAAVADRRAREYEAYALNALETGEEAIARQCAEVVAAAETERCASLSEAGVAGPEPRTANAVLARLRRMAASAFRK
jgi:hypothetical protein